MSTIASPRPSISASSRRTSTSTDNTHPPPVEKGSLRRNRAALRDYYGLKNAAPSDARDTSTTVSLDVERESELDRPDFDTSKYVTDLLAKEGVDGVLKVEAGLASEIRSLDSEKKALVYDNYSKLIAATDTIKNMREKMDPMTPTTSTLTPAIGHIAETASSLSNDLKISYARSAKPVDAEAQRKTREQQATVKWVLAAPERLQKMVGEGNRDEAEQEWEEISGLLQRWSGVRGVDDVRKACLAALKEDEEG
jgi:vacuolar protein sorting-associated protein 51